MKILKSQVLTDFNQKLRNNMHSLLASFFMFLGLLAPQTFGAVPVTYPVNGGTGTSTKPTYGKLLLGNASGLYNLVATSSLGITSGVSSVSNSDATLTISPTTGAVIGSLNLDHANSWTNLQTLTTHDANTTALMLQGSSGQTVDLFKAFIFGNVNPIFEITQLGDTVVGGELTVAGSRTYPYWRNNAGTLSMYNSFQLQWSSGGDYNAPYDIALKRNAANILEINNGTAGTLAGLRVSQLGIATSSPAGTLGIAGAIFASSTTATSTFVGKGINLVTQAGQVPCYAVNGTCLSSGGGGSPGGSDTQVQFNDSGSFGGDAGFTFNKTTDYINIGNNSSPGGILTQNSGGVLDNTAAFGVSPETPTINPTDKGTSVALLAGDGGATSGAGGVISLIAGSAQGGNSDGGAVIIHSGQKIGSGLDGELNFSSQGGFGLFINSSDFGDQTVAIGLSPTVRHLIISDGSTGIGALLDTSSLASSDKTFTFPNTTGTFCLTTTCLSISGGLVTSYAGTSTQGYGISPILRTNDVTGKTTDFTIATYTPTATSTFRIGGYIVITAVSVDVIQFQAAYTDETGASRTQLFFPQGLTSAALAATGSYNFPTVDIRVKANTTITVSTHLTTGAGSITYDAGGTIQQIN